MSGQPPRVPPPYQPTRLLGEGGMGAVWEVRHQVTGGLYALKVIRNLGGAELARFQREARTLAQLNHLHVVRVHAAELEGAEPWFVQDLLEGGSLEDRIRAQGPLDPEVARRIAREVALGVDAAHRGGILHRDLKPENVLFDADGVAKVADFGLASAGGERLTLTGEVLGTPAYMAPEQGMDASSVGAPADVYALGGVLYAMLTGRPPLETEGMSLIAALTALQEADPPHPRELNPAVPDDLAAVAMRALEKEPRRRFASAAAFHAALEGGPVEAPPAEPLPVWAIAVAVCVVLALAGAVALVVGGGGDPPPEPSPRVTPRPREPRADPEPTKSPPRAERLYRSYRVSRERVVVAFSGDEVLSASAQEVCRWSEGDREATPQVTYPRGNEPQRPVRLVDMGRNGCLVVGMGMRAMAILGDQASPYSRSLNTFDAAVIEAEREDGELQTHVALARRMGQLKMLRIHHGVAEMVTASRLEEVSEERLLSSVCWLSPTELLLAARGESSTKREELGAIYRVSYSSASRKVEVLEERSLRGAFRIAFNGEETVAITSTMGAVLRWRVGLPLSRLEPVLKTGVRWGASCRAHAFASPERLVVTTDGAQPGTNHLVICDLVSGESRHLELGTFAPWSLAIDSAGERAAVGSQQGEVRVYSLAQVWEQGSPVE